MLDDACRAFICGGKGFMGMESNDLEGEPTFFGGAQICWPGSRVRRANGTYHLQLSPSPSPLLQLHLP